MEDILDDIRAQVAAKVETAGRLLGERAFTEAIALYSEAEQLIASCMKSDPTADDETPPEDIFPKDVRAVVAANLALALHNVALGGSAEVMARAEKKYLEALEYDASCMTAIGNLAILYTYTMNDLAKDAMFLRATSSWASVMSIPMTSPVAPTS
eukprot:PhF_6_TR14266/c0_g1_i3/m.22945